MTTFHIITIFPESFSYLGESIIGRAIKNKLIKVKIYNLRDFAGNKRGAIDDRPYSGGPGMVMQAMPIVKAVEKIKKNKEVLVIIFSPGGKEFNNIYAKNLAKKYKDIILVCGHYEGIDARVKKILKAGLSSKPKLAVEEISIGNYVLTGGEVPAMVVVDSVSRQIEGVLHKSESLEENRISSSEVYTRPEVIKHKGKDYKVPQVLLSGNHAKIKEWKKKRSCIKN